MEIALNMFSALKITTRNCDVIEFSKFENLLANFMENNFEGMQIR